MDFTSGDAAGDSDDSRSKSSSKSSDRSELDPEHAHLLQLQDTKESLLTKRNALVREIETLQSSEPPVEFKRTALLDLAELVPTNREVDKKSDGVTVVQDGHTAVEEEIRYKHDCLPLLNMELRLSYLHETYPYAKLKLLDNYNLHVIFTRNPNDQFELDLQLPNGSAVVSRNVRWPLRELQDWRNPTAILQGCYEFDRLRCKRDEIFQVAYSSLQRRSVSHHASGSLLSLRRGDILLQLRIEIELRKRNPFPQMCLSVRLFRDELAVMSPNVQEILQGLIQEYGVVRGVLELCKSCFI